MVGLGLAAEVVSGWLDQIGRNERRHKNGIQSEERERDVDDSHDGFAASGADFSFGKTLKAGFGIGDGQSQVEDKMRVHRRVLG